MENPKKTTAELVNEFLSTGRSREAVDLCRGACETPMATPRDFFLYGCVSATTGDLITARRALGKAVDLDPKLGTAHFELGKILANAGEYTLALDHLRTAAKLQKNNPDIWLALGITCGLANELEESENCCRRSLELKPNSVEAMYNLANALQGQGKLGEAEARYEAVLKIRPGMINCWSMLAQARVGLSKFAEAEVAANRALALDPGMGEAHFTLGNIATTRGDKVGARDHFLQAVKRLPNLPDAHMRLGQVLYAMEDYSAAAESFRAVTTIDPGCVEAHYLMGVCFEENRLLGRAVNCHQKVLALDNDHLQAHYSLAFIFMKLDRHAEAAGHLTEVLRINPNDEQAKHLLASQQGETTATAPAAYVKTLFDGMADTFDGKLVDELNYHTPEYLYDMVSQYRGELATDLLDIIDLGCGTGLCAPLFRPMAQVLHGVDLSPRMIEKARERGLYDTLEVGDVVAGLKARDMAWDLVIASDVFVYVGDLRELFTACKKALKPGGLFAFSIEAAEGTDTFILTATGRYAHASSYIQRLAADIGFSEISHQSVILRKDKGLVDVNGYIFLLQRNSGTTY
jgi:predicted TPR repeat methyltransferase